MRNNFHRLIFFFLFCFSCQAKEIEKLLQEDLKDGLIVDLREPQYSEGVLSTDKGGVITASQLRIQALQITYTRQLSGENPTWKVEASCDLIVEFGEYIFIGERLVYDFQKKEGIIYRGTTSVGPWFFGGEELQLRSDGSYLIINGFVTTSERDNPDWGIYSGKVFVEKKHLFTAEDVKIRIFNVPVLWIPSLRANLDSILDSPIRYRFRLGGRQGPRVGVTYEIFSWKHWKTFVRFDYRLTRGPGGGIETYYHSLDDKTKFHSINYLSKDSSILHLNEKARYRFEGNLRTSFNEDKSTFLLTYDKISDKDMPNCYYDQDFFIQTAYRTQMLVRHQEENWIGNFYTRVRINGFQTVKEQLPSLDLNLKPFEIFGSGVIFENAINASYLDFKYSNNLIHVHDYCSTRFQYRPKLYRPFVFGPYLTFTPELGAITQIYGNSPEKEGKWLLMGTTGFDVQSQLYRHFNSIKHSIEPYLKYRYFSSPTSSPNQHYIFDIEDGLTRWNSLSFGIRNTIYRKQFSTTELSRLFCADIYAYAFFNTHKMRNTIPRIYGEFSIFTLPTIRHTVKTAWNFDFNQLDYFNIRTEWTVNNDLAIATEYRHRGSYSWRKVDPENFFLDLFHSEERLRHSALSDRRDTLLINFFYRFHPNWACMFTSRQGWNRHHEPGYFEYEIDLLTTVQTAWHLRLSLQRQQTDTRVAMYVNVGLSPPRVGMKETATVIETTSAAGVNSLH